MKQKKYINKFLIFSLFIYLIVSVLSIYSASMYLSPTLGNLPLKQLFWYIFGFIIIIIISKIDNDYLYKFSWYIYLANIVFLGGLLVFAPSINGSKAWYIISGIGSFQPSEFMKIALILMNASIINYFYKKYRNPTFKEEFKLICLLLLVLIVPSILTFLEPDTGAVIIYFIITIVMLFISGIRKSWFILLGSFIVVLLICFFGMYFLKQDMFINIFGSNFFYRMDRVINWRMGSGMQLNNSLIAIGSSDIIGHGFNHTPLYFPEAGTDFIFTVFASNFGLLGSISLICFILYFDIWLISLSKNIATKKDKYIMIGIISMLIYQQIQNIGMTIGLLPITGITLPFISYGGSSLISYLILIGIISNIEINDKRKKPLNNDF